jgi:nifR3 family TIM-barrel protein
MTKGFWENLPRPFFALAPLYDVTDAAFRHVIARHGKPHVFYTEFTSTDGLQSAGRDKLMHHLQFSDIEHPIVAQVFGTNPEKFRETAELVKSLGFDGMDINMGCPDKNIIKTGSCAALFNNPGLAQEIIAASKEGAKKNGNDMPVSVKIRIGDSKIDWQPWVAAVLKAEPAAIAVHLRTRKEMSAVPAHWELMPEIVKFIKDNTARETCPIIIGNGDVETLQEAREKSATTGCDGVMFGRAIFGNPWLFNESRLAAPDQKEKLQVLLEHVQLYDKTFSGIKPFDIMKRHFKAYINGFGGAPELRAELYECKTAAEVSSIIQPLLANLPELP